MARASGERGGAAAPRASPGNPSLPSAARTSPERPELPGCHAAPGPSSPGAPLRACGQGAA
eukprot:9238439-Pyramimonas_sp.AAC.1